jgi:heat shock protein HslJ
MFTTDSFHPVLTRDAPDTVEILMVRVGGAQSLGASRSLALAAEAPRPPGGAEGAPQVASEGAAEPAAGAAPETDAPLLRGHVTFMAEAARFTDCATGRMYLVSQTGDYAALEHAYVAAGREPGGPVMVSFEGEIIERPVTGGTGTETVAQVERFVGVWADEACEAPVGNRPLVETDGQIRRLRDSTLDPVDGQEPARLQFHVTEGPQFSASVGCNSFVGGFDIEGDRLTFGQAAATLMACPPPLDVLERRLGEVLGATNGWRIAGNRLELLDAHGMVIGEMEATEAE